VLPPPPPKYVPSNIIILQNSATALNVNDKLKSRLPTYVNMSRLPTYVNMSRLPTYVNMRDRVSF
jgi:cell division septal protein FtsQ